MRRCARRRHGTASKPSGRIRANNPKLLVILALTAYGTTCKTAIEAMKLGAYDYLLKPFDAVKIKELVGNALKAARDMKQKLSPYEPMLEIGGLRTRHRQDAPRRCSR